MRKTYAVAKKKLKEFNDPSRGFYLNLLLTSNEGTIVGNMWDGGVEAESNIQEGDVIEVDADKTSFRGSPQLNINGFDLLDSDQYEPEEFIAEGDYTKQELVEMFDYYIDNHFSDKLFNQIHNIIKPYFDQFFKWPAAQYYHHAYIGGLAVHSLEVFNLVSAMLERIHVLNIGVDTDLALVGALIHDVGKVHAYNLKGSIVTTTKGDELGHLALGLECIEHLPESDFKRGLRHIIASHHGKQEWGAITEPQTIEAHLVHQADAASSQITKEVEHGA